MCTSPGTFFQHSLFRDRFEAVGKNYEKLQESKIESGESNGILHKLLLI